MSRRIRAVAALGLTAAALSCTACVTGPTDDPRDDRPPEVTREFRGVWIATVANIDWPSAPGLPVKQQQDELLALLDQAAEMNLNAVIFQVRTTADALYESSIEPWSAYLTGEQGRAPEPFYDPLQFAIEHAHERGLELHAWINPLRASHPTYKGELDDRHVTRTMPAAVPTYGTMAWMDPGHPDTLRHTLAVVRDLVGRYDLDGLHIDDYFYPYPQNAGGKKIAFPDGVTYDAYRQSGGTLARDDWRRQNVDTMVEQMHRQIKAIKPHVKFGISPFGIWRPGHPDYVKGMDQYAAIYADAKRWLEAGWCDYFTPQLYWSIENPDQSFLGLLDWWSQQNPRGRHLWPGLYASRTADGSSKQFDGKQVPYQVRWSRLMLPEGEAGHVHFSMKAFMEDRDGLRENLKDDVYPAKALTPRMKWLSTPNDLPRPRVAAARQQDGKTRLSFVPQSIASARWLTAQWREGEAWREAIAPATPDGLSLTLPDADDALGPVWVRACDRLGHPSRATRVHLVQTDRDSDR